MAIGRALVGAAAVALLVGCGGGSPMDKMMEYQDEVLTIVENNKHDLDKAAEEVRAFVAANKEDIQATLREFAKMTDELKADPERAQKAMAEFRAKTNAIEARMKALEKEVPGVAEHADLKAAIETLRR